MNEKVTSVKELEECFLYLDLSELFHSNYNTHDTREIFRLVRTDKITHKGCRVDFYYIVSARDREYDSMHSYFVPLMPNESLIEAYGKSTAQLIRDIHETIIDWYISKSIKFISEEEAFLYAL